MSKIHLIYASKSNSPVNADAVEAIRSASFIKNMKNLVTGLLCYGNGRFLQYLEGEAAAVNGTYARIAQDPRHTDLRLLLTESIDERSFASWAMHKVIVDDQKSEEINRTLREYFGDSPFAPENLSSGRALQFILEIARLAK